VDKLEPSGTGVESAFLWAPVPTDEKSAATLKNNVLNFLQTAMPSNALHDAFPLLARISIYSPVYRTKVYADKDFIDAVICFAFDTLVAANGIGVVDSVISMPSNLLEAMRGMFKFLAHIVAEQHFSWLKHFADPARLASHRPLIWAPRAAEVPTRYRSDESFLGSGKGAKDAAGRAHGEAPRKD